MIKTWQQRCEEHPDHDGIVTERMIQARMQEEIDELRVAIEQAQPEQKPVFELGFGWIDDAAKYTKGTKLYATPPRQWQGLTDEEIAKVRHLYDWTAGWTIERFARAIEAKLKEKNYVETNT